MTTKYDLTTRITVILEDHRIVEATACSPSADDYICSIFKEQASRVSEFSSGIQLDDPRIISKRIEVGGVVSSGPSVVSYVCSECLPKITCIKDHYVGGTHVTLNSNGQFKGVVIGGSFSVLYNNQTLYYAPVSFWDYWVSVPAFVQIFTLPDGQERSSYEYQLSASGGNPPFTYSIVSGSLPSGLSLSSTGKISGVIPGDNAHAVITGVACPTGTFNLPGANNYINLDIDASGPQNIDLGTGASVPISTVISAINAIYPGCCDYILDSLGVKHIRLTSYKSDNSTYITFNTPTSPDATNIVFGISPSSYPYTENQQPRGAGNYTFAIQTTDASSNFQITSYSMKVNKTTSFA